MGNPALDRILRKRLDDILALRTKPAFAWEARDLLKLESIEYEGVELAEDGKTTIVSKNAKATVVLTSPITKANSNANGVAHGGWTSFVTDMASSLPLVVLAGEVMWKNSGLTSNNNVFCLAAMPIGSEVRITAKLVQKGKSTASCEVRITDSKTGQLCGLGLSSKTDNSPPPKAQARL